MLPTPPIFRPRNAHAAANTSPVPQPNANGVPRTSPGLRRPSALPWVPHLQTFRTLKGGHNALSCTTGAPQ